MELQKIEPESLNGNKTSKQNVDLSSSGSDETQKKEGSSKETLDNESQEMLIDQSLTEESGCVRDTTTTAVPIDTTTNQMETTTFATSTMESTSSVTTKHPTGSLSPSSGLSVAAQSLHCTQKVHIVR